MATTSPQPQPVAAALSEKPAVAEPTRISAPLTAEQIAIVKSTAPILKERGVEITTLFYNNMLEAHPELRNVFNRTSQATGAQPRALASAVLGYASYVDDLGKLSAAVERIAHKHVSLVIQPEHYPIVGKHLIEAVATVLGPEVVTPAVGEAWTAAYGALADIFIGREKTIYASHGGWTGWRRFRILRKVAESDDITSFYFVPEDGKPLPSFKPGQYISVQLHVPEMGCMQPRQYSLSDAPGGGCYRISVKRDAGKKPGVSGLISNMLHDQYKEGDVVELTHPTGDFFLADAEQEESPKTSPLVLISAGVGLTPVLSMLNTTLPSSDEKTQQLKRPISWIHGAHNAKVHAFGKLVRDASARHDNFQSTVFLSNVGDADVHGTDYHFEGRVDLDKLVQENPAALFLSDASAEYYICGPSSFMQDTQRYLTRAGVSESRIHMEVFGVGDGE
ncbi:flavohemoglobin [Xylariales sp. PMI_506]|nr:flavohemoglobin [Xylariales sp. PMI_506]